MINKKITDVFILNTKDFHCSRLHTEPWLLILLKSQWFADFTFFVVINE